MPRINLLPWREELRKERQKNFAIAGAVALGVAALVVVYASWTVGRLIDHQRSRNDLLKREIAVLDDQIKEINGLERQRERLLARMEIIEQLQRSRPEIVHVFDELVKTLPDGVYLKSITQVERRLEIRGVAESSTRVSAYMRNIDASEWLADPRLEVIERLDNRGVSNSEFTVKAQQVDTTRAEEEI